jgi:hypothetical protein
VASRQRCRVFRVDGLSRISALWLPYCRTRRFGLHIFANPTDYFRPFWLLTGGPSLESPQASETNLFLSVPQLFLTPFFLDLIKFASSASDGRNGTLLRFDLSALVAFAQSIYVDQILCSARPELCSQQILSRDNWYRQIIIYSNIYSPSPRFLKFNAADFRHDGDHHRRRTHSKEVIGLCKVLGAQSFNRCPELRKRGKHSFAIFSVCANQNIQIFCRTWLCMKRNRVSANI